MTTLQIGLTLSVVGPREKLLAMDDWPMALRLTAGTDSDADLPEAEALTLIEETVPWKLWEDLTNGIEVAITPRDHTVSATRSRTVIMPSIAEDAAFLSALKAEIVTRAQQLAKDKLLTFAFRPEHSEVADEDEMARTGGAGAVPSPAGRDAVPWPGLLATLQTHAAPTPASLRAIWYFTLPAKWFATNVDGIWQLDDVYVSAAPANAQGMAHAGYTVQPEDAANKYPVHAHAYKGMGTTAFCQALRIKSVVEHDLDEMDNFWLAIRDSGDESLLDLGLQLDSACEPAALLSSLSGDELAAAMQVGMTAGPSRLGGLRAPTPPEAARAVAAWKERLNSAGGAGQTRSRILRAAATARTDQVGALRAEFLVVGVEILGTLSPFVDADSGISIALLADHHRQLVATAAGRLLPMTQRGSEVSTPAEGISLMVGDLSQRLRHVDDTALGAVDDVAQLQLFGRRSSELELLNVSPATQHRPQWHCLSAGAYRLRGTAVASVERVLGVTATYVDDVLCREIPYAGSNVACENPLAGTHRESLNDDPLAKATFILAPMDRVAATHGQLRVLPMRYGDYYEFAASVVDRAGGMAAELTGAYPWDLDWSKLEALNPPQHDRARYLRRSAVGDCDVQPGPGTSWPQTPSAVVLRGLENLTRAPSGEPAPMTVLLVPSRPAVEGDDRYRAPSDGVRPPEAYEFLVTAPRASEHVQMRWRMPATTLEQERREQEAEVLMAQVGDILQSRDAFLSQYDAVDEQTHTWAVAQAEKFLPYDPAVAAIGMSWQFGSGASGHALLGLRESVEVAVGVSSTHSSATAFAVSEGDYVQLRFYTLVATADMDRFDAAHVASHLADSNDQHWAGMTAFTPKIVVVESATSALPAVEASRLSVEEDSSGNVRVFYDFSKPAAADRAAFLHVDKAVVTSERWVWRNLPLPPEDGYSGVGDDRARRLVSGPPKELMDAALRDSAPSLVQFDQLVEMDDGFAGRADQEIDYPRQVTSRLLLTVDARNLHSQAEYLRYALACRSRYAPVLRDPLSPWTGKRRIAIGFRGDHSRIKPPRILAVLPLTQAMPLPIESGPDLAPPFLVVIDEVWFREYGIGERLVARVAHVKPEIPETPSSPPTERRYGPLPDHRLDLSAADPSLQLDVFGPFGLSHDRTGSQALANASAFVVYPPKGTPPHFNVFAEFARVLDLPTQQRAGVPASSEFGEAVALYTLPDMAAIALGTRDAPLRLRADKKDFVCAGADRLTPFPGAKGAALQQYRYLLIVGHHVRDGGRAVDVFLPSDAMWLTPAGDGRIQARWVGGTARDLKKAGFNAAVVLEILLNGRFPIPKNPHDDLHPLSGAQNMADVFRAMLSDAQGAPAGPEVQDAPAMVRRASAWFPLEFS